MLNTILDPVMSPLLKLSSFYSILIVALLLSIITTLIYKWATDQTRMKRLKKEMKKFQDEMKHLRKEPEKLMKVQKKAMAAQLEYMKMSLKPTLYTFLPIIIIFAWMSGNFAYHPLEPNQVFNATIVTTEEFTGNVTLSVSANETLQLLSEKTQTPINHQITWKMKGEEGTYILYFKTETEIEQKQIIITNKPRYESPVDNFKKNRVIKTIVISNNKIKPMKEIPLLRSIPWIGNFGWLGTYILFSLIFTLAIRKIFDIQ